MINIIKEDTNIRMKKCVDNFQKNISKIRSSHASTSILDEIKVEYYGKTTKLNQISSITLENSYSLKINLFDISLIPIVEKAIISSKLGLNPIIQNNQLRIVIPKLTEERRKELVKIVRNEAENSRISIRNIRRDSNDKIKRLVKDKKITNDKEHFSQEEIQKITKFYIKKIDTILLNKEIDLMKF